MSNREKLDKLIRLRDIWAETLVSLKDSGAAPEDVEYIENKVIVFNHRISNLWALAQKEMESAVDELEAEYTDYEMQELEARDKKLECHKRIMKMRDMLINARESVR